MIKLKKKKKFCLELNSHSLSDYQMCEKRFQYNFINNYQSKETHYPFKRGAAIAKYLFYWYEARLRRYDNNKLRAFEDKLFKRMIKDDSFYDPKWEQDDKLLIASRLMGYFNKYRNETYQIISVEKGFSKVIFENEYSYFIYSGRPDLVVDFGRYGIGPIDHKSESRENNLASFQNQFVGYCWAIGSQIGLVNYIGLQKDFKEGDILRRTFFTFTPSQINKWKSDTIKWYRKIAQSVANKDFTRSWRCEGKYGICMYYAVCTAGTEKEELIQLERNFNKAEKPYRSW